MRAHENYCVTRMMRPSVQALEAGACEPLAHLSASENAEEQAIASKALTTLLNGATTTPAATPFLGPKSAVAAAERVAKGLTTFGDYEGTAGDLISAHYAGGGGIPLGSIFPLMQLLGTHGVAEVPVDVAAVCHALATAAGSVKSREAMVECVLCDDTTRAQLKYIAHIFLCAWDQAY
jgi:hypothetical protein